MPRVSVKKVLGLVQEPGQVRFRDAPDRGIVHRVISMNDSISKADDARKFRDELGNVGIKLGQAA